MCLARLAVPRPTVVYGRFACEYVAAADAISVGGKYWHVRTVAAHVTSEFFAKPMAITAGRRLQTDIVSPPQERRLVQTVGSLVSLARGCGAPPDEAGHGGVTCSLCTPSPFEATPVLPGPQGNHAMK